MSQNKGNLPVNTDPVVQDGGSISYANEVIAIISGIAASEIEGIAGMVTAGGLGEIISKNRNITRGVKVDVGSEEVSVDLYTIVEYGQPIQKVASEVQENVRKSIESMTGLKVVRVDVHVQGVSFEKDKKDNQTRLEAANIQHITGAEPPPKTKKDSQEKAEKEEKETVDNLAKTEKESIKPEKKEPEQPANQIESKTKPADVTQGEPEKVTEVQPESEKPLQKPQEKDINTKPAPKAKPTASKRKSKNVTDI